MMVGGQRVAAPEDDELREAERLGVNADTVVAERVAGSPPARDRADRHDVPGGANDVPEPAPRAIAALEKPHAARAQVRPYGFRPELADDAAEPLGDLVERLVPGDPLEVAGPLRDDAPHRVPEPLRGLRVRDVVVELVAQDAAREGVRGIALQPNRAPILDGDHQAARVRTVHRAGSEDPRFSVHQELPFPPHAPGGLWFMNTIRSISPGEWPRSVRIAAASERCCVP